MNGSFKLIHRYLIAIAIVLLPVFNSLGTDKLGALGRSASTYPLLLGVIVWLGTLVLQRGKVYYPRNLGFFFLLMFLLTAVLSGLFNLPDLYVLKYQGISGIDRFFIQIFALLFYVFIVIYIYNAFYHAGKEAERLFVTALSLSFFLAGGYSLFEIGAFINVPFSTEILGYIDTLFRANEELYGLRLRSLANEASMFAMYCTLIFPWIFSRFFRNRRSFGDIIIVSYFILLMGLTFSRTAYIVFIIQLIVFFILYRKEIFSVGMHGAVYFFAIIGILTFGAISIYFSNMELFEKIDVTALVYSLVSDDVDNPHLLSNIARYSSQIAAIRMFFDHPVLGVGLGGFGFYAPQYYPDSLGESWEIIAQSSNTIGGAWPVAHGLYVRILAEMGILGLVFWLFLWGWNIFKSFASLRNLAREQIQYKKNLLISLIGMLLIGFVGDSLTWASYWIYLGFLGIEESNGCRE